MTTPIDEYRAMLAAGASLEQILVLLRLKGLSRVESMRLLIDIATMDLATAKKHVHFSRAWADLRESTEALHGTIAHVFERDAGGGDGAPCCRGLLGGRRQPSPFTAVIALGYYDGETSGLAECGSCGRAYRFELVAWDGGQDVRVFAGASLAPAVFGDAVVVCSRLGVPRWPVWVPLFGDGSDRVREALDILLGTEPPAEFLFATSSIEDHVLAAERVPVGALPALVQRLKLRRLDGGEEWFQMLGLALTNPAP